jgi:hypothetical protein
LRETIEILMNLPDAKNQERGRLDTHPLIGERFKVTGGALRLPCGWVIGRRRSKDIASDAHSTVLSGIWHNARHLSKKSIYLTPTVVGPYLEKHTGDPS